MCYGVSDQGCKKHSGSLLIGGNTVPSKDRGGEIELVRSTKEKKGRHKTVVRVHFLEGCF